MEKTDLGEYKRQWIKDHATLITVTARRHGIPPEVLAGIAHTEVGGKPDTLDNYAQNIRSATAQLPEDFRKYMRETFTLPPQNTSAGDNSIQLRNVATLSGLDPDSLSLSDRQNLISRLQQDKPFALDMAARYVKDKMMTAYPTYKGGPMTDQQILFSGYAYNMGYPHEKLNPQNPDPVRIGKTKYGPDLLKKIRDMSKLLSGVNVNNE